MKQNLLWTWAFLLIFTAGAELAAAQLKLKLPRIKVEKPKESSTTAAPTATPDAPTRASGQTATTADSRANTFASAQIYPPVRPDATPRLLKSNFIIRTRVHDSYWKMPKESNYSSWVPEMNLFVFYNDSAPLNYRVDYFQPDGTPWLSQRLEYGRGMDAERTVSLRSADVYSDLNSKSTPGVGVYKFKIVDVNSDALIYQGSFKVGKFSRADRPTDKNKADFYVDHDWLLPYAMVGFHHSLSEIGGNLVEVSFWLKGATESNQLEARLFYNGQQIASTNVKDGVSGASAYEERMSEYAPARNPAAIYKRWRFQWNNFRAENNGTFDRAQYPNAHYADKNPGTYTVKVYQNGAQIRETTFAVGTDGKFTPPAYTKDIFLPYHRLIFPAKVMGADKWNQTAWKTDSFYGNPLPGFSAL